jgi:hypothetical protein
MERRDFLMREIEKLILAIKRLIGLVEELTSNNFEESIKQINNDLIELLGFNINDIEEMTEQDFILKIKDIDDENSELLAVLLSEISKKINHFEKANIYNSKKIAKKATLLLSHIEEKTTIFSFKRMILKKELQQFMD